MDLSFVVPAGPLLFLLGSTRFSINHSFITRVSVRDWSDERTYDSACCWSTNCRP